MPTNDEIRSLARSLFANDVRRMAERLGLPQPEDWQIKNQWTWENQLPWIDKAHVILEAPTEDPT